MSRIDPILLQCRDILTHQTDNCGFRLDEARQLLEFCIELNDQDSRIKPENANNPDFQVNFGTWRIIYDSREGLGNNPENNGFGAFENAWILVQNQTDPKQFSVAIRGTIGQARSILNDVLATTISANSGIEFPKNKVLPIVFAATPGAEVHLGFAYGAFTLLFDKQRGILKQLLSDKIPSGAQLTVAGHSQGAAIATLVHAFLHYAVTDPADKYGLKAKNLQFKSYVYAQPKPGNSKFAMDFARIASGRGAGFVINNTLDPITKLPLTSQTLFEAVSDTLEENQMQGAGVKGILIKGAAQASRGIFRVRNQLAEWVSDKTAKLYHQEEMQSIDTRYFDHLPPVADTPVNSLNYTLSGQLIPLFGVSKGGDLYPPSPAGTVDLLLQHHAPTYRKLLNQQMK